MTNEETADGIDWEMWLNSGPLQSWKACALSMDINPDTVNQMTMAVPRGASQAEFVRRRRMLEGNLRGGEFTPGENWLKWVDEVLWLVRMPEVATWCERVGLSIPPAWAAHLMPSTAPEQRRQESAADRQDRRLRACEAAGLTMPKKPLGRLPNGVGIVADAEQVSRQAFSEDVKAALARRESTTREGAIRQRSE